MKLSILLKIPRVKAVAPLIMFSHSRNSFVSLIGGSAEGANICILQRPQQHDFGPVRDSVIYWKLRARRNNHRKMQALQLVASEFRNVKATDPQKLKAAS